jgi:hypothetical protein
MKSKLVSLLLLLAAVMLGGVYYWQFFRKDSADILSSVSLAPGQAAIIIDFGSRGSERLFRGEVVKDMSLLDALRVSAMAGNLELQINGELGAEKIVKIDGLADGEDGGCWNYYLDGKKIEKSLSAQTVSPGDRFKFVYE